jgi:hypothetical protein
MFLRKDNKDPPDTVKDPIVLPVPCPKSNDQAHLYHAGKMRISLHAAEIKGGVRGQLTRRLKDVLKKTSAVSRIPTQDLDVYQPIVVVKPAEERQSLELRKVSGPSPRYNKSHDIDD